MWPADSPAAGLSVPVRGKLGVYVFGTAGAILERLRPRAARRALSTRRSSAVLTRSRTTGRRPVPASICARALIVFPKSVFNAYASL